MYLHRCFIWSHLVSQHLKFLCDTKKIGLRQICSVMFVCLFYLGNVMWYKIVCTMAKDACYALCVVHILSHGRPCVRFCLPVCKTLIVPTNGQFPELCTKQPRVEGTVNNCFLFEQLFVYLLNAYSVVWRWQQNFEKRKNNVAKV